MAIENEEVRVEDKDNKAHFYKEVDKGSSYPSWYLTSNKEKLKDSISMKKQQLQNISDSGRQIALRESIRQEEERLALIDNSEPKLTSALKEKIAAVRKELGDKITSSMPSYSDVQRGIASSHNEVKRLEEARIELSDECMETLKKVGLVVKRKITGLTAEKYWKLCSRVLDENSNTEALRKMN